MQLRTIALAAFTVIVMASAGGCEGLPSGLPSGIPTSVPSLPDIPTELPDLGDDQTAAPPALEPSEDAVEEPTEPDPVPSEAEPVPSGSAEPGVIDDAADAVAEIPWWVWALLLLAVAGLIAAIVALRRARAEELRWAALWHELTGEARWLDERVVPAVQDRALDLATLSSRWADGSRRFDDLDRRVWAAANEEQKPSHTADLNALSESLLRLRDAVDTEVSLRTSGIDQPGLPDAAQTVADARDELRRTVTARTR